MLMTATEVGRISIKCVCIVSQCVWLFRAFYCYWNINIFDFFHRFSETYAYSPLKKNAYTNVWCGSSFHLMKIIFHNSCHFILRFNQPFRLKWHSDKQPSIKVYDVNLSRLLISYKLHLRDENCPEWRQ